MAQLTIARAPHDTAQTPKHSIYFSESESCCFNKSAVYLQFPVAVNSLDPCLETFSLSWCVYYQHVSGLNIEDSNLTLKVKMLFIVSWMSCNTTTSTTAVTRRCRAAFLRRWAQNNIRLEVMRHTSACSCAILQCIVGCFLLSLTVAVNRNAADKLTGWSGPRPFPPDQ